MIFSGGLCEKVLDGTKTQTRRPVKGTGDAEQACQYQVGKTYAVQPGRGKHALGRILVLSVENVNVAAINEADARAEGFAHPDEFLARWRDFYGVIDEWSSRCWRIEFVLVGSGGNG